MPSPRRRRGSPRLGTEAPASPEAVVTLAQNSLLRITMHYETQTTTSTAHGGAGSLAARQLAVELGVGLLQVERQLPALVVVKRV